MIDVEIPESRVKVFTKLTAALQFVEMSQPVRCLIQKIDDSTYLLEYSGTNGDRNDTEAI